MAGIQSIWWDLDEEPDGNVQHIAEHGVTKEEVEEVLGNSVQSDGPKPLQRASGDLRLDVYRKAHPRHLGGSARQPLDRVSRDRLRGPTAGKQVGI